MGKTGWRQKTVVTLALLSAPAVNALHAQVSFERVAADLASRDPGTRLKAVQLLKEAAYPEAAMPLVPLITDPQDEIQLEAIAAELNIFLAEPVVTRKRVGLVVEKRSAIVAEAALSAGPGLLLAWMMRSSRARGFWVS